MLNHKVPLFIMDCDLYQLKALCKVEYLSVRLQMIGLIMARIYLFEGGSQNNRFNLAFY